MLQIQDFSFLPEKIVMLFAEDPNCTRSARFAFAGCPLFLFWHKGICFVSISGSWFFENLLHPSQGAATESRADSHNQFSALFESSLAFFRLCYLTPALLSDFQSREPAWKIAGFSPLKNSSCTCTLFTYCPLLGSSPLILLNTIQRFPSPIIS